MDMPATDIAADQIVTMAYSFRQAKALMTAVELDVFTVLAQAPGDADALVQRLQISERTARDFLDTLVALGLLDRDQSGTYSNTSEAALYLDRNQPTYIGGLIDHVNHREYPHWNSLTTAIRTGLPQTGMRNLRNPEFFSDEPALKTFARGMTGGSVLAARAIATQFPWGDYASVVDVGTSEGCLPIEVALTHAHITCFGFDRPQLETLFNAHAAKYGVNDRVHFRAGDFFTDAFPPGDVIVLGRVLHNWDLPTKRMLLQKAYAALPDGGALIVYERFIDDHRRTHAAALLSSLNMMVMTNGGYDCTTADCAAWMREAGFGGCRLEPLTEDISMLWARK